VLRLVDSAMERVEKPSEPLGDVQRRVLGLLQEVVVSLAFALNQRRQTVEALRATVGACQQQITDGPGDTAIAIVERVQSNEPQMAEAIGGRRFEIHPLATDGARAPMSTPNLRAIDERTDSTLSCSPSISLVLTTSSVSAARLACFEGLECHRG
jgi:hypothetical protein